MPISATSRPSRLLTYLLALTAATASAEERADWHFDLGSQAASPGHEPLSPATHYDADSGFGLEGAAEMVAWSSRDGRTTGLTSPQPFFLSAAVPAGLYNVTVTLGHPEQATAVTVKSEARRLMLQNVQVAAGSTVSRTFTVAVKRPQLQSGRQMKLKASQPAVNWDDRLTLEFNGTHPSVIAVDIEPAADAINVFVVGDSTVTDQDSALYTGWGQMLPRFFQPGVAIINNAQSGDSLRSLRGNGLLDHVWEHAKPGDYLLIQFGHNDQKDKREGAGPFTTYKQDLEDYISKARSKDMHPVLISPMERRRFSGTTPLPTLADFAEAVRQVAAEQNVPMIDLNAESLILYGTLGPEGSKKVFLHYAAGTAPDGRPEPLADNSHFDNYGGYELARIVATGIAHSSTGLERFLVDDFVPFDPRQPDAPADVVLPLSPLLPSGAKPEGS